MPASLRLALNSLLSRPLRSSLLTLAVALSAAMIAAVACAMASAQRAIEHQLAGSLGSADLRIKPTGANPLSPSFLPAIRAWPEVRSAAPYIQTAVAVTFRTPTLASSGSVFRRQETAISSTALANSLNPDAHASSTPGSRATAVDLLPPPEILLGRLPNRDDEVLIDATLAHRLSANYQQALKKRDGLLAVWRSDVLHAPPRLDVPISTADADFAAQVNASRRVAIGDTIEIARQLIPQINTPLVNPLQTTTNLTIVGIAAQPPLGGRPQIYLTLPGVSALARQPGLTQIDIALKPGIKPDDAVRAHSADLPSGLLLQTTEKITSGLDRNVQSARLGLILAMVMGAISGAFIIATGLTTAVAERQRELAILRCIGATQAQLARTQLLIGLILGLFGAILGVPIGVAFAAILTTVFQDQLPSGLAIEPYGLALAASCAIIAGVLGSIYPAWQASRLSPLLALASRATPTRPAHIRRISIIACIFILTQILIISIPKSGQVVFWGYATLGLPLMFTGYFLLGIPTVLIVNRIASPIISRLLRLPPHLLPRTVAATPARHGLTAGALMGGLALMVAIWTNGGAILRDWISKIQFPDAFVSGLNLSEDTQKRLQSLTSIVADTSAITLHPVQTDVFGVHALQRYKTSFVGFEPDSFFRMTRLTWIQGDPDTARRRLNQGGAVIVAREFYTAQHMGVGSRFTCSQNGKSYDFEIVGVVSSPGLELVSKFFNVGEDVTDQALHAVFGSRADLRAKFFDNQPAPIQLIQIQFTPDAAAHEEQALETIRRELLDAGILDAGSGRQIKTQIITFATGGLVVISSVGALAMLIASFGVANIIIAGIDARQFQFGVLRAIGAPRALLTRLVIAEALLIALTAAILGTLLGIQGAWAGRTLHAMLLGLTYSFHIPPAPVAIAWAVLITLTLLAATPAVLRLARRKPRELLASTRG
jgi:putative ABC transport system permease protein